MSLLNKNLKLTEDNKYPCSWESKITQVTDCMNDLVYHLEHDSLNIVEHELSFDGTNIDIILRGDLEGLSEKVRTVSEYLYEFAEIMYHVQKLDLELKSVLFKVVNEILTPKLIEDSSYKIINFNLKKYEKDPEYTEPTIWQRLLGKKSKPNDYLQLYVRVDKKKTP